MADNHPEFSEHEREQAQKGDANMPASVQAEKFQEPFGRGRAPLGGERRQLHGVFSKMPPKPPASPSASRNMRKSRSPPTRPMVDKPQASKQNPWRNPSSATAKPP